MTTAPVLSGIHHLKVHVADLKRSARWYQRVLGYQPSVEFAEAGRLVGYGLSHPDGGTFLTLRLDPDHAALTAGHVYFEMGTPDKDGLDALARHLDTLGERHGAVVRTPVGWLLPDLRDPDGHEMRFYVTDHARPTTHRPIRINDPGPDAWAEPLAEIDLAPNESSLRRRAGTPGAATRTIPEKAGFRAQPNRCPEPCPDAPAATP